jgi:DNA modification methylase
MVLDDRPSKYENAHDSLNGNTRHSVTETKPLGLEKQCDCQTNETKGGTVLDPFGGSGTTGIVAASHSNRNAILLELNQEYIDLAKERINKELGMMANLKCEKENI